MPIITYSYGINSTSLPMQWSHGLRANSEQLTIDSSPNLLLGLCLAFVYRHCLRVIIIERVSPNTTAHKLWPEECLYSCLKGLKRHVFSLGSICVATNGWLRCAVPTSSLMSSSSCCCRLLLLLGGTRSTLLCYYYWM